jgi:predicted nucleic acid-binding protein
MTLVIDAGVALRWYVEAPGSPAALALLHRDEPLVAPDLLVPEVSRAAWKLARANEITREHGKRIVAAIAPSFDRLVESAQLASQAYALASLLDCSVNDCFYLALAELEKCVLVTADQRLLAKVEHTAFRGAVVGLLAIGGNVAAAVTPPSSAPPVSPPA